MDIPTATPKPTENAGNRAVASGPTPLAALIVFAFGRFSGLVFNLLETRGEAAAWFVLFLGVIGHHHMRVRGPAEPEPDERPAVDVVEEYSSDD